MRPGMASSKSMGNDNNVIFSPRRRDGRKISYHLERKEKNENSSRSKWQVFFLPFTPTCTPWHLHPGQVCVHPI